MFDAIFQDQGMGAVIQVAYPPKGQPPPTDDPSPRPFHISGNAAPPEVRCAKEDHPYPCQPSPNLHTQPWPRGQVVSARAAIVISGIVMAVVQDRRPIGKDLLCHPKGQDWEKRIKV